MKRFVEHFDVRLGLLSGRAVRQASTAVQVAYDMSTKTTRVARSIMQPPPFPARSARLR